MDEARQAQPAAIAHDSKGNRTLDARGNTYAWDFDNRLKEVRDSAGDLLGSYTYDAMGRRVTKTVPGASQGTGIQTAFVCMTDNSGMGQVLAEYETQSLKRLYTYGEYIDEAITLTTFDATNGEELFYFHRDRQYNITGLTNDSPSGTSGAGVVQERYAYTPYGQRRILAPDGLTIRQTSAVGNPIGHQGLYHDGETDLIYNRARYRDGERWLSRDPLEYVDTYNMYQYVASNPFFHLDPSGLVGGRNISEEIRARKRRRERKLNPKPPYNWPQYSDEETAAGEALGEGWKDTRRDGKERCGMICKDCDTKKYYRTVASWGQKSFCLPQIVPCQLGDKTISMWHTHPDDEPGKWGSEWFSPADEAWADFTGEDFWLITPSGDILNTRDGQFGQYGEQSSGRTGNPNMGPGPFEN